MGIDRWKHGWVNDVMASIREPIYVYVGMGLDIVLILQCTNAAFMISDSWLQDFVQSRRSSMTR
jgi:hypothetical protein